MEGERETARRDGDPSADQQGSGSSSGFTFNLGAALDRLGTSKPTSLDDLLHVGEEPTSHDGELPTIAEATSVEHPPHAPSRVVLPPVPATPPATEAPLHPLLRPVADPQPARPSHTTGPIITPAAVITPAAMPMAASSAGVAPPPPAPVTPVLAAAPAAASGNIALLDGPAPAIPAPTIPAPVVPAYVPPPSAPAAPMPLPMVVPGVNRPAAKKAKRRSGMKVFVLLLLIGGLVAGGLTYGRAYLFPDEWDEDLVPIADELESNTGLEFAEAARVTALPSTEYDVRAAEALFGAGWSDRYPQWRALGLADGAPTAPTVGSALRSWAPATYDPVTGDVVRLDSLGGSARTAAVTEALTAVLVDQLEGANLAMGPSSTLAQRAVIARQIELTADDALSVPKPAGNRAGLTGLPAPLAYELLAQADLGAPIAERQGIELDPADPSAVADLPASLQELLGAPTQPGATAELLPGDVVTTDPAQQGRDFWYLVFGSYLPTDSAAAGADAIAAETLTPVTRGAQACVYATFAGATPDATNVLRLVIEAWVAAAPTEALAQASVLADGSVQLITCDPGEGAAPTRRTDVAAELVARQVGLVAAS